MISSQYTLAVLKSDAALELKDQIVDIYRAVYTLPPDAETEVEVKAFGESWEACTKKPGFLFVGAFDRDFNMVGYSYGWSASPEGSGKYSFNSRLLRKLGESRSHWLKDCFYFANLSVLPRARGQGMGRELKSELLKNVQTSAALLLTYPTTNIATEMYKNSGWKELPSEFEAANGRIYKMMTKELR